MRILHFVPNAKVQPEPTSMIRWQIRRIFKRRWHFDYHFDCHFANFERHWDTTLGWSLLRLSSTKKNDALTALRIEHSFVIRSTHTPVSVRTTWYSGCAEKMRGALEYSTAITYTIHFIQTSNTDGIRTLNEVMCCCRGISHHSRQIECKQVDLACNQPYTNRRCSTRKTWASWRSAKTSENQRKSVHGTATRWPRDPNIAANPQFVQG